MRCPALLEAESMVELGRTADGQRHLRQAVSVFEPLDPNRAAAIRELL